MNEKREQIWVTESQRQFIATAAARLEAAEKLAEAAGQLQEFEHNYPLDNLGNCLFCNGNYNTNPPQEHHNYCVWVTKWNKFLAALAEWEQAK